MSTVLKQYDRWKQFLGERVEQAEKVGMNENTITKLAVQIGEFLSDKVDPENKEERVLKELWDVADDAERQAIASVMVKLAKNNA